MKLTKHKCKRCGHEWASTLERLPKACPACKSYAWQTEKKKDDN